ncbi:hypothetical protein [Hymenobacter properus]|uniref:Uncharacterized protein n=1 Tax=Hymenobacter properus TaxID=2791026 RepID=A0A931BG09_9BACT|nr:hypothetical protein [Hymenobacter properus]MBF9140981.1 hypothetical protein [Hymenobacter properus]MBR7719790.1 hypothetical protein [Microvirga sp. SRT04]
MKATNWVLALAMAGNAACQHQTPPTAAVEGATAAPLAAASAPEVAPLPKPSATEPKDTLTPEMLQALQRYDFSPLLQTVTGKDSVASSHVHNGFFGPDHYRIEVVFTEVRRDSAQPALYHLRGQDRYKSVVTPFAGTFTVTQLADQAPYSAARVAMAKRDGYELRNDPNLYSALGKFELREDSTRRGAGVFRGRVAFDWQLLESGSLVLSSRDGKGSTQGGDVKFEGTWTHAATHRTYPVVWVENIFTYAGARNVLKDFFIGERDPDFNPKYAKLGWNSYWENDEWWAKPTKPALSL